MKYLDKIEKSSFVLCLFSYVMYLIFESLRLIDALKKLPLPSEEVEGFRFFSERLNSTAHLFENFLVVVFIVYVLALIFNPSIRSFLWIKSLFLLSGCLMATLLVCYVITAPTIHDLMSEGSIYPYFNTLFPLVKLIPYAVTSVIILFLKSIFLKANRLESKHQA